MYYSKRSRTILSLLKKDQVNKKRSTYVDRIKSLPYMPFLTTPLVKTIQMSSERMFYKREDNALVPRVAILFNDNKGYVSFCKYLFHFSFVHRKNCLQ